MVDRTPHGASMEARGASGPLASTRGGSRPPAAAEYAPVLEGPGPLPLLDGAFAALRRGGGRRLLQAWLAGLPLALVVLSIYYLERIEGIRGLRPLFALALVLAWIFRALVLGRVARDYALLIRPSLPVASQRPRPVDAACTALLTGLGLWCWLWPLGGLLAIAPYAPAFFLPVLALRGAVAPSWLARSSCSSGRGSSVFAEAVNDTGGMRGTFTVVELFVLFGLLGLFGNLSALLSLALLLSHSMLGLNVAFVAAFASPDNPLTLLLVASLCLLLAEPLRAALSAQAFVDARTRRDGADLHAAVDALVADRVADGAPGHGGRGPRRGLGSYPPSAAAALLWAAGWACVGPSVARAEAPAATERAAGALDEEVRQQVNEILAEPAFREFADGGERGLDDWFRRLLRWLEEQDGSEEQTAEPAAVRLPALPVEALMALAIVALCVIGIYATSRSRAHRFPPTPGDAQLDEPTAVDRAPRSYLDEAGALAQRGEFRGALRALYLATLVSLDRARLVEFEPSRTNWQYLRMLPRGELRKRFAGFTRVFDHKWYGREPVSSDDYERCRRLASAIMREAASRGGPLAPAPGGAPSAGLREEAS